MGWDVKFHVHVDDVTLRLQKEMQFVRHDAALKGQSKSIGNRKIHRTWKDLKSYFTAQVTAKGKDKALNPRLLA